MSSFEETLGIRGFLENFEKLLVLVYSHEFRDVTRSISLILKGDLLAVTSDGFVVYQIYRTLAYWGGILRTGVLRTSNRSAVWLLHATHLQMSLD